MHVCTSVAIKCVCVSEGVCEVCANFILGVINIRENFETNARLQTLRHAIVMA